MQFPGRKSIWVENYQMRTFEVSGRPVSIVMPEKPAQAIPWAWKGEFLNAFPATELALLRKGFHIVYMQYTDMFGSPDVVKKWDTLYAFLTRKYGFAEKPALIGLSRGGLYCYNWAIANPDKVACIYGDAPVCDMKSWPGGKGKGSGSPRDWEKVMDVFGFSSEQEATEYGGNPIDNLRVLAEHNIPILHVYGDADDVVPWDENTGVVAARYRELGGSIELICKPGCGHHPHGLDDPSPIVDFICKYTVNRDQEMKR
jgi:pimeloyl-ACP methyl ester carboxylesterase